MRRSIFHRNTIYRSVIIEVNRSPQISAHKDGVSFSLLFLCASRKTHRQTVGALAVNLLRQKRKKPTLAETLHLGCIRVKIYLGHLVCIIIRDFVHLGCIRDKNYLGHLVCIIIRDFVHLACIRVKNYLGHLVCIITRYLVYLGYIRV